MDFDLSHFGAILGQLLAAIVLALPIAWERERSANSAGLRTFPLVAAASCVYVLLGTGLGGGSADSESRIVQGLITGIGFVGGGAILKMRDSVHGTATAASIWMTGALGAAVGYRQWEMATAVSLLTFGVLQVLPFLRRHLRGEAEEATERPDGRGESRAAGARPARASGARPARASGARERAPSPSEAVE